MIDYLEISSVPTDEPCQQLGARDYDPIKAKAECMAFINQLRRQFGPEPRGATLRIRSNQHDFGTYHEVAVKYDDSIQEAVEYAFKLEAECPENWDEAAKLELANFKYNEEK